jgi:hypothetical protein
MKVSVNYRMIPDVAKGGGVITSKESNKKVTTVAPNTYIDCSYEEVVTLNGWVNCGVVGPSTARPANATLSEKFIDTTLNKVIFSDGRGGWHDPFTGGLV